MFTNCQKVQNQANCCNPSNSPSGSGLVGKDMSSSTTTATSGRRATIAAGPSHEQRLQQQQLQQLFRKSKEQQSSISGSVSTSMTQNCVTNTNSNKAILVGGSSSIKTTATCPSTTTTTLSSSSSSVMDACAKKNVAAESETMKNTSQEGVIKQKPHSSSAFVPGTSVNNSCSSAAAGVAGIQILPSSTSIGTGKASCSSTSGPIAVSGSSVPVRGISKSPQPQQKTPPISMANRGMSTDFSRRPIYPNFPFSPFTSPGTSPYLGRRRQFRESQRVSVEQVGDTVQLNQYKLMHPIGQGSYGIVKLAYNEEDDEFYAMKILSKRKLLKRAGIFGRVAPSRKASGKTAVENPLTRVYREVAILKKLDHPNVVKLVEVLDDPTEDNLYLVFELLERGEVLEIPTTSPLPEDVAWKYFRDVVLGLEYLHYQKIIHRDIKPSNLLVSDDDRIKIADFGVCNEFNREDDAILTSTTGTPAFVAPEALAIPKGSYSGKMADIWQLGVTLYALIYGEIPFNDGNIMKLYDKIQHDELNFPPKPEASPLLKDMLLKMLQKDPKRRITLPEIKVHDWVTKNCEYPLPTEEENCLTYVEVTDDDIMNCVRSIPKLDTLILVKTMLKHHSFQHPFKRGHTKGRQNSLHANGRSHSAPSSYNSFFEGKVMSLDSDLPIVSESAKESLVSPRGSFINKDPASRNSYRKN